LKPPTSIICYDNNWDGNFREKQEISSAGICWIAPNPDPQIPRSELQQRWEARWDEYFIGLVFLGKSKPETMVFTMKIIKGVSG
jgi:hypothetical protein